VTVEYDGDMAVPDFQTLMRPLLEEYAAAAERPNSEVRAALASKFALTAEELAERLPSGTGKTFDNRVWWAATERLVGMLRRLAGSTLAAT
jgi:restriction system protein